MEHISINSTSVYSQLSVFMLQFIYIVNAENFYDLCTFITSIWHFRAKPPRNGQPPNSGQNARPQSVHYSEVPLYMYMNCMLGAGGCLLFFQDVYIVLLVASVHRTFMYKLHSVPLTKHILTHVWQEPGQ